MVTLIQKKCVICGKYFLTPPCYYERRKTCSFACCSIYKQKKNEYILHDNYAEIIIKSKKYGEHKALIDLDDVEKCKKYNWCLKYDKTLKNFYLHNSKGLTLHRFITDCPKNKVIDHLNHNTLDNRKENLRICTDLENLQNKKSNTSGHVGVSYYKRDNTWEAFITIKGHKNFLGRYKDINDAIKARKQAEKEYFGYTQ